MNVSKGVLFLLLVPVILPVSASRVAHTDVSAANSAAMGRLQPSVPAALLTSGSYG